MLLEGRRIFVVEDDPVNMAVIAVALKEQGAIVAQDPWNADTLHRIKEMLPIDLILLDLMLRYGVSGYDIFDQVRQDPEVAGIPIVAVTASDPGVEMARARDRGFAGYITKPVRRHSLARMVASVLDGTPVWAEEIA